MAAVPNNTTTAAGIFKKVYEKVSDIQPKGFPMQEVVAPFEEKKKAGSSIEIPTVLSMENGVSMGDGSEITFADAQAGIIKAASVVPHELFVSSAILTSVLSRAAAEGEQAVKQASKHVVANNLKSHMRFREHNMLYGQDSYGIGRVSYETKTWRGASLTAGAGTVGGVTFSTGGINAGAKKILVNTSDFAPGLLIGAEGMEICQRVTSGDAIADTGSATGKIVSVDLTNGIIEVDFTPIAATGASSHYLQLKNAGTLASAVAMVGAKKIMTNTSSLFGIDAAVYGLWKGVNDSSIASGVKLTYARLLDAVSLVVDRGCDKDLVVLVGGETWNDLIAEQMALRNYDSSYKPTEMMNGAQAIKFQFLNGTISIQHSRFVRRSDCFVFAKGDWKLYGSADISMKVPGLDDGELLVKPITSNSFTFRSYSDSQIFCAAPCHSLLISGIDPSSAS